MQTDLASPDARHVRRLHVRAAAEDDARHAVTLLTDALRTASFGDHGRLIVIRRLALGRIPPRASPATLALHVERVTREILSEAVSYDLPAAASATVVAFPNRAAAIVALARLQAGGFRAADWLWSSVVSGWRADVPREQRWFILLDAAHRAPEAPIVAASVIGEAVRAGVEDELLASIPPGQGATWLRRAGWSNPPTAASGGAPAMKLRRHHILARWQPRWGPADDRLVWCGTLLAIHENPARSGDARLPVRIRRTLLESLVPVRRGSHGDPEEESTFRPRLTTDSSPRSDEARASAESPAVDATRKEIDGREPIGVDRVRRAYDRPPGTEGGAVPIPRPDREPERIAIDGDLWLFSPCGGLLFLVPILERLGFAAYLASDDRLVESGFAARLLLFIGDRVGLRSDDPLRLALSSTLDDVDGVVSDLPFAAWLTAVRRWCRRNTKMGLVTLIRRPGRIRASTMHIDSRFDLSQIDIRLRRLALDVDPGWVPWLGRVIRFHYLDPDEHDD